MAALRRRLERAPVKDHRAGLTLLVAQQTKQLAQVVSHGFENPRFDPTLRLLPDREPGRQVVGQPPPGASITNQIAQRIKHLAQLMISLGRIRIHQGQIRGAERPFFIGDITGIPGFPGAFPVYFLGHPKRNAWL